MIVRESPHQSSRRGHTPRMIIIHGDAGRSDAGTVSWIQDPRSQVSYHYLVGRNGDVYRFVSEDRKAWHAGKSAWDGHEGVNEISIGVAFANDGTGREAYQEVQYQEGAKLVAEITRRHSIPIHLIRGHDEVSPGRKTDPWAWFDWRRFYGSVAMFATGRTG